MPAILDIKEKVKKVFPDEQAKVLDEVVNLINDTISAKDFNELKNIVRDIAITQKELAEAQKRTEIKVEELAEAQKRTEIKVEELAEAQKRTEIKVEELAEAQKRTEEELKELIREHQKTREQIGGLSGTVGYYLEDLSYPSLPFLLREDAKIELEGYLERRFIEYPDGGEDEINIYGKGKINEKEVYIIGEAKSQIGRKDVEAFIKLLRRVKSYLGKDIIPVMVCYMAHPKIEKYIKEKHPEILIYKSFELKRRSKINN